MTSKRTVHRVKKRTAKARATRAPFKGPKKKITRPKKPILWPGPQNKGGQDEGEDDKP